LIAETSETRHSFYKNSCHLFIRGMRDREPARPAKRAWRQRFQSDQAGVVYHENAASCQPGSFEIGVDCVWLDGGKIGCLEGWESGQIWMCGRKRV